MDAAPAVIGLQMSQGNTTAKEGQDVLEDAGYLEKVGCLDSFKAGWRLRCCA